MTEHLSAMGDGSSDGRAGGQPHAACPITILIAARNASATIERAVRSAVADPSADTVLLIDDHSTDDTVARARAAGGGRLRIVAAVDPGGVARARQTGLDAVETEFAAWLDADDEWMPGRATRLTSALMAGHDVAVDGIELRDGPTGAPRAQLSAPVFLRAPGAAVRLFERNFLPGDTQVGFRVSTFREVGGYDPAITGPESLDLLLRAIRGAASFTFIDRIGYRMHAYAGSLSRDIERQSAAVAAILAKHAYMDVYARYRAAGYSSRVAHWALVSMAIFRLDPASALVFLERASPETTSPDEILEPDGPWPFAEGWRRHFQRGTILLMLGRNAEAEASLRRAESIDPTAEGANNLGVAESRLKRRDEAVVWFALAAARFPGYYDARVNAGSPAPARVTSHPLRRTPSRNDYAVRSA